MSVCVCVCEREREREIDTLYLLLSPYFSNSLNLFSSFSVPDSPLNHFFSFFSKLYTVYYAVSLMGSRF